MVIIWGTGVLWSQSQGKAYVTFPQGRYNGDGYFVPASVETNDPHAVELAQASGLRIEGEIDQPKVEKKVKKKTE